MTNDLTMFTPLHHTPGMPAMCEIPIPGTSDEYVMTPCEVIAVVSAEDRDYRINVRLDNGREIGPCAPECIHPIDHA